MAATNHSGANTATDKPELAAVPRQAIDANRYLAPGTVDQHGVAWVSAVWNAHAGYREFLWVSDPQAGHSRSIEARPQVSIVIFDSSVPRDAAPALYLSGAAGAVTGPGLENSVEIYSRRSQEQGLPERAPADVQAPARPRLYWAVAAEQFVLPAGATAPIPVSAKPLAGNRRYRHAGVQWVYPRKRPAGESGRARRHPARHRCARDRGTPAAVAASSAPPGRCRGRARVLAGSAQGLTSA